MKHFDGLTLAMDLISAMAPLVRELSTKNRDLADQLRRAATSAASCLAEGWRRIGRDRLHLFRTAEGSAAEVKAQLEIAVRWGELDAKAVEGPLVLADRLVGFCYSLTRDRSRGGAA